MTSSAIPIGAAHSARPRLPPRSIAARAAAFAIAMLAVLAVAAATSASAAPLPSLAASTSGGSGGTANGGGSSLEQAATRAGDTGRRVAMSLIGLGLAIAAVALCFRRDFKEAAGVLAVGMVAILLATPAGLSLLQDTVTSVLGGG